MDIDRSGYRAEKSKMKMIDKKVDKSVLYRQKILTISRIFERRTLIHTEQYGIKRIERIYQKNG